MYVCLYLTGRNIWITEVSLVICHVPLCLWSLALLFRTRRMRGSRLLRWSTESSRNVPVTPSLSLPLSIPSDDLKVIWTYGFISTHNLVNTAWQIEHALPVFHVLYPLSFKQRSIESSPASVQRFKLKQYADLHNFLLVVFSRSVGNYVALLTRSQTDILARESDRRN